MIFQLSAPYHLIGYELILINCGKSCRVENNILSLVLSDGSNHGFKVILMRESETVAKRNPKFKNLSISRKQQNWRGLTEIAVSRFFLPPETFLGEGPAA
jgi:hypothetical protein